MLKNESIIGWGFLLANVILMLAGALPLIILLWIVAGFWLFGEAMKTEKAQHAAEIKRMEERLAAREAKDQETRADK